MSRLPNSQPVPQLQMVWPHRLLNQPPLVDTPARYRLRTYRPGDEERFIEVMHLAGWPEWNTAKLEGIIGRVLPDSWFMAVDLELDQIVATAMALHDHTPLHPFGGELGWVGSDPAHRGRGLGTCVCAAVTARLLAAGYRDIHLYTEHFRLPALKIYLKLGYVPFLHTEEMLPLWRDICQKLDWPYRPEMWQTQAPAASS